jgi:hypothetical protein
MQSDALVLACGANDLTSHYARIRNRMKLPIAAAIAGRERFNTL